MPRYSTAGTRSRKRPRGAPTFVATVPLRAGPGKAKALETRFEVARLHYNACLGECLRRIEQMRADPRYEEAGGMPKQVGGKSNPERSSLFAQLRVHYGFDKGSLASYGSCLRRHFVREHVGAQEAQVLAERAYDAANMFFVGKRGRPRFKGKGHKLHCLAVKDANGDIRITKDGAGITWAGLGLPFALDQTDPVLWWAAFHVAAGRLLRVGVARTAIRGRPSYRALLVLDGVALQRYETGTGKVSLDPGLGYANVVTDTACYREQLAGPNGEDPGIGFDRALVRRLSRRLDRQHRAGSPGCFDGQGRHVRGRCDWRDRSAASATVRAQLSEAYRKMAAHRQSLHGNLQNRILGTGADVTAEKNSYKSFQRNYGRSVRDRAPGTFIKGILRKAASAGGEPREGDPRISAPSQTCACGARKRKPLSLRVHTCDDCGAGPIQRDVFSAFLWRHVATDGTLDAQKARDELSRRQDIAVHAASGEYKHRVPLARKRYGRVSGRVLSPEMFAANPQNPVPPGTGSTAPRTALGDTSDAGAA